MAHATVAASPEPVTRSLETTKATLVWSADGRTVTKSPTSFWDDPVLGSGKRIFRNEQRMARMLEAARPPVPVARLHGATTRRSISFEAIDGEPLGPKYPTALTPGDVADMVQLVTRLSTYQPRRRWFRRFPVERRLHLHEAEGLLTAGDVSVVRSVLTQTSPRMRFAHADITARNVLRDRTGKLVLIDWEWAGLYPESYELAFLWFSVIDVPDARAEVEKEVGETKRASFVLSALFVQLLHLHMWMGREPTPFIRAHEATKAALLAELRLLAGGSAERPTRR